MTPKHYQTPVSPWDLQASMHSSGNAYVDARRCDAIKYIFRDKENLLEDLKKAKHCIEAAINKLEAMTKDVEYFAKLRATPTSIFFKDKTLDGTKELPTDQVVEIIHTPSTKS